MKGRFFVTPDPEDPHRARLDAAGARHLRALRLARGDQVCAIVGPGRERSATITALTRDHVLLALGAELAGPSRDPQAPRTLALALGDPVRMDLVVEKATELGATAIQPFVAARSQARSVGDGRLERWRRIARAACEQCGRTVEPDVRACIGLEGVIDLVATVAEAWLLSPWRADRSSAAPPPVTSSPPAGAPARRAAARGRTRGRPERRRERTPGGVRRAPDHAREPGAALRDRRDRGTHPGPGPLSRAGSSWRSRPRSGMSQPW